jgi:hypothetical protein
MKVWTLNICGSRIILKRFRELFHFQLLVNKTEKIVIRKSVRNIYTVFRNIICEAL